MVGRSSVGVGACRRGEDGLRTAPARAHAADETDEQAQHAPVSRGPRPPRRAAAATPSSGSALTSSSATEGFAVRNRTSGPGSRVAATLGERRHAQHLARRVQPGEFRLGVRHGRENARAVLEQHGAGLGGLHAERPAHQQRLPQFPFECRDLLGRRRSRCSSAPPPRRSANRTAPPDGGRAACGRRTSPHARSRAVAPSSFAIRVNECPQYAEAAPEGAMPW
ncbi:hypothetical protein DFR74_10272 [Nocardia puris]|uniref:Uncharacterized protein n=1 Tax=Nocardia puris TaxID=208602 RepID=A0A366DU89_9NOCA|nr:hypothetical protein DFR74_10272 [Nocardia puris]